MARPKQTDLGGMTGPGVELPKHKDLDRLGDEYIDVRDRKAELATELGTIEKKIIDKMEQKGLLTYTFSDQQIVRKQGKSKIKIKTVKVDTEKEPEQDPE